MHTVWCAHFMDSLTHPLTHFKWSPDHQQPPCWFDLGYIVTWIISNNIGVALHAWMKTLCSRGIRKLAILWFHFFVPMGHHDDVIKWKHFPCYWPFVRGIHLSPVNSPHKGQWRGALMFALICVWINGWVNNSDRHRAHYDVIVMQRYKCSTYVYGSLFEWFCVYVCVKMIMIDTFGVETGIYRNNQGLVSI